MSILKVVFDIGMILVDIALIYLLLKGRKK